MRNFVISQPRAGSLKMYSIKGALLASAIAVTPAAALAQVAPPDDDADVVEEALQDDNTIVVTGEIARTIENSLETKRELDVIGDAIVGEDVGDLPDLSVAETLERIVGVTSDRFKGGASELSVRGLGAFLGSSAFNGREVSSGSDGRDVNYGQFPSELINGAIIYKSQQASFIEGGVSGIIELQTLRPVDYGKQRLQVQGLVGLSPYQDRVVGSGGLSTRLTASYIDQFDLGGGELGIAIGGQMRNDNAPEDIYTSSSTYRPCNTVEGMGQSNNCDFEFDDAGNPTGAAGDDFYLVSNQYIYRAQTADADRDAIMGAIQWQPSPSLDINLDAQYSFRDDVEERANLVVADGRRDIVPLEVSDAGALLYWSGETRLENQSVWRQRTEEYLGLGGNISWTNGRLVLTADAAYSETKRRQDEKDMRIRTNDRVLYELDQRGYNIPNLILTDVSDVEEDTGLMFDLDNHDLYDNGARARRRLENVDDSILAFRLDGLYEMDGSFNSLQVGARWAQRERFHDDGIDETVDLINGYDSDEAIAARQGNFLVSDLYAGSNSPMRGLTFATWDAQQLFAALTGSDDAGLPTGSTISPQDTDVTEETWAGYVQANFDTDMFGSPARGNVGFRAVRTEITSIGISSAVETSPGSEPGTVIVNPIGEPVVNTETNDFWNFLPSANIIFELDPDVLLRLAAYRAIARPDQEAMSAALSFSDDDFEDVGRAITASGNPLLEPLESWNGDISFEWYASPTTSLAVAGYYKSLQTGFQTDVTSIDLLVDGVSTPVTIARTANSDDKSDLYGFEATLQHKFDFGLGFLASYNYADSNFEFPDPTTIPIRIDGTATEAPLANYVQPANIPGYSKHSLNGTVFFETGPFSARLAYKWRSDYFKPFRNDANRYTEDQGFLDFSASMDLMDGVQMRFQALNILDEPNVFYRPTPDSLAQTDYSGARYFIGLRGRF